MMIRFGTSSWRLMLMGSYRVSIRGLLGGSAIGVHVLVLLAVVAVPGHAIANALGALLDAAASTDLGGLIDLHRWLVLLGNTAVVCGVALATATLLGTVVGFCVARTDLPGRTLIAAAAIMGACVPLYVSLVFVFSVIPLWRYANSAVACGLLHGLFCTPLAIVVLAAAFRSGDRELEDQARLDAAEWLVLLRVTIPQAGWAVAIVGMIVVLIVATDFTIADILLVRTFAEEVYTQYALHRSSAGPVIVCMPALVGLALMLLLVQLRYKLLGEHSPWQFGTRPRTISLGGWRWAGAAFFVVAGVALLGPPAVSLLRQVGSIEQFAVAADGLRRELLVSAFCALAGATIVVVFAVGLAWGALRAGRFRWLVGAAVVLLLAMPAPVVGISLTDLLNRPGWVGWFYDSLGAVVLGYVVRFLPFGIVLLLPGVQRVPAENELAARVDGCDWLAVQRHVYWPAVAADALVVWLVIVILCFGEVGCTVLVAPPGWPTASVRAFTLIHFGVYRDLAVLAIAATGCILVPWLALAAVLLRRIGSASLAARR